MHHNAYINPLDATADFTDQEDDDAYQEDGPDLHAFQAEQERIVAVQRHRPVRRMRANW